MRACGRALRVDFFFVKIEGGCGGLVAQCSAIGVNVAATPPRSAIRFCKELLLRDSDRGVAR